MTQMMECGHNIDSYGNDMCSSNTSPEEQSGSESWFGNLEVLLLFCFAGLGTVSWRKDTRLARLLFRLGLIALLGQTDCFSSWNSRFMDVPFGPSSN